MSIYGFYAKNDNGGLLCCDYAAASYELKPNHIWHDSPAVVYRDMDNYGWSSAYGWSGWGASSYKTWLVKWAVYCDVPHGSDTPKLFFTASNPANIWITSDSFQTRSTWETDGGANQTWTEGRSNTPSMVVAIDTIEYLGPTDFSDRYKFTVIQSLNDGGVAGGDWGLLFRVFVPVRLVDRSEGNGFEVYDSSGRICFTSRPHPDWFLYQLMEIDSVVLVDQPDSVADQYSMAPSGNPVYINKKWVSYSSSGVGAKIGDVTVYRSHRGGGGYGEVSFTDNYYFVSHGLYCTGVTPGAASDGNIYASYITLDCGRELGKTHSEDWGMLGVVVGVVTAIAAIYTGGMSLAAGVGLGAVVGAAIGSMSFYHGMQPGDTRTEVIQNDTLVVLR
jgi:hypothetical protein